MGIIGRRVSRKYSQRSITRSKWGEDMSELRSLSYRRGGWTA